MDCSTSGFLVLHCLLEFAQTHVRWVGDVIQQSHPLSSPSLSTLNLSQHQSFPMSLLFALSGQSIGASASAIRWHRKLPSMVPECNWYTVRVFLRLPPHHQLRKGSDSSASRRSTQKAFKQLWDKAERDTWVYLIPQKPLQINWLIQGHYLVRHKLALTAKSKSYQGSPNSDKSIPTPPPPLWPTFLFLSFCFYPSWRQG